MLLFIFSVITLSFYQAWALGTRQMMNSKYRLGATAMANQQMEIVRSLIFDNIGTTDGIIHGTLQEDQHIAANTTTYHIHFTVQYIDDPRDGTGAAHTDLAFNDYKQVTVRVSWGGETASEQVEMVSLFSLDGVESVAAGTGILSINVLNAAGVGVSDATVHIVNSSISPSVDMTADTDAGGNLTFPGAKASVQKYRISVSKGGYYPNTTYAPYPTTPTFKPTNVDGSVVAGNLSMTTLVSDQQSSIRFRTRTPSGETVPNVGFSITGGLVVGTDTVVAGKPVYDFTQTATTDSSGEHDFLDRSTGMYTVTLGAGMTGYRFLRLDPQTTALDLINLPPGMDQTVTMALASKTVGSTIITAKRASNSTAIAGATVRLTSAILGYDVTVTADAFGQAYFPMDVTPLTAGTYDITVSASGFTDKNDTVTVPVATLVEKSVSLST